MPSVHLILFGMFLIFLIFPTDQFETFSNKGVGSDHYIQATTTATDKQQEPPTEISP